MEHYIVLLKVCRQTYLEVVGSGILYTLLKFAFTSEATMYHYLLAINPRHKDLIRSIHIHLTMTRGTLYLSRKALLTLASLPSFRYLEVHIDIDYFLCAPIGPYAGRQRTMEVGEEELRLVKERKHWKAFENRLWGLEIVFRVPWRFFDKKLDIELRDWEVVAGERRTTRYEIVGDEVRKVVCEGGRGKRRTGQMVAVVTLETRRAVHIGEENADRGEEGNEDED